MHVTRLLTGRMLGSVAALAVIAGSFALTPATLPWVELCYFHRLTGIPCPGCGLTSAVCSISHGEFAQAWDCNPFGYLAYAVAIAFLLRPLIVWLLPGFEERVLRWQGLRTLPALIAALMVLFGLWRIFRTFLPSI